MCVCVCIDNMNVTCVSMCACVLFECVCVHMCVCVYVHTTMWRLVRGLHNTEGRKYNESINPIPTEQSWTKLMFDWMVQLFTS